MFIYSFVLNFENICQLFSCTTRSDEEAYNMAKAKWTESCLSPIQDDSIILADKLDYCGNSLIEKT